MKHLLTAVCCMIAAPALAQTDAEQPTVYSCDETAHVTTLAEPWEKNTATFADGAIRVAVLDYTEPAAAAMKILILGPPYDELGLRTCQMIGLPDRLGFASLKFAEINARYDPGRGLTLALPVQRYPTAEDQGADEGWYQLSFTIDQATGDIALEAIK